MQTPIQPLTFTIPAIIRAIPRLTLTERVVLAHLATFPRSGNGKLARLTWLSIRGVESLLSRLLKQGHLQRVSVDGSRHLLVQGVAAAHSECGDLHITKLHTPCGIVAGTTAKTSPATSMAEAEISLPLGEVLAHRAKLAASCVDRWEFYDARSHYEACLKRVAVEVELAEERRARMLEALHRSANQLFALENLAPKPGALSPNEVEDLTSKLGGASSEKLIDFRRQVEGGACSVRTAIEVLGLALPGSAGADSPTRLAPCVPRPPAVHPVPGALDNCNAPADDSEPVCNHI